MEDSQSHRETLLLKAIFTRLVDAFSREREAIASDDDENLGTIMNEIDYILSEIEKRPFHTGNTDDTELDQLIQDSAQLRRENICLLDEKKTTVGRELSKLRKSKKARQAYYPENATHNSKIYIDKEC